MSTPRHDNVGSSAAQGSRPSSLGLFNTTGLKLDIESIVGNYLRPKICQGSEWTAFVEGRRKVLRMSEQLQQYEYMKRNFDKYVNTFTPSNLPSAPHERITRVSVDDVVSFGHNFITDKCITESRPACVQFAIYLGR